MSDSRIHNLTSELTPTSLADLTNLFAQVDASSFGDAKKLEIKNLLTDSIVVEGSNLDYKALTPKGFAASVATETRKGIVELATDAEVISETSGKIIVADQQSNMREHWGTAKGSGANGQSKQYLADSTRATAQAHNFIFPVNFYFNGDGGTYTFYPFDLTKMKAGLRLQYLTITGIYGMTGAKNRIDNVFLDASGGAELRFNNNNGFKLVIPGTTAPPYIMIDGLTGFMMLSMTVYALAY